MRQGEFIATMISLAHLPEACRSKVLCRLPARSPRETPKSETRLATTRRASGYALQIHHKHPQFSYPLRIFLDSEPRPKNRLVCPLASSTVCLGYAVRFAGPFPGAICLERLRQNTDFSSAGEAGDDFLFYRASRTMMSSWPGRIRQLFRAFSFSSRLAV
jgi:hypothetical protein